MADPGGAGGVSAGGARRARYNLEVATFIARATGSAGEVTITRVSSVCAGDWVYS